MTAGTILDPAPIGGASAGMGSRDALEPAAGLRALDPKRLGLWVFLATVTMLFAAFSSAYLVRMSTEGWGAIALPGVLWVTTVTILLSSATMEMAALRTPSAARWLLGTLGLGVLFLAGQGAAWRALHDAGVFLPQSPHAAFLYIFTALHGARLLGGLVWIAVLWRAARSGRVAGLQDRVARCATYWHFMGGLWVYLFAVLHLG